MLKTRALILTAAAAFSSVAGLAPANAEACTAPDADATPLIQDLPDAPAGITGHVAMPDDAAPTMLVVYGHGYRNISDSWVCHLLDAADRGAIALATDYAGTGWTGAPGDHRGWFVREGAREMIEMARYFQTRYPSIAKTGLLGVSMGGNATGLAASATYTGDDGIPHAVFDYWVDVEGAANLTETYAEASLVQHAGGTTGAYAAGAVDDIEREIGFTPNADPVGFAAELAELSVVTHADEIADSGIKGVAIVHGLDDGLVPYNQSRELATLLRANGLPTSMYTVLRRNDWQNPNSASTEGGTVLSSNVANPVLGAAGQRYSAPLAGHGWEGSSTHLVIRTGFDVLWQLMFDEIAPTHREVLVDSELGHVG